MKGITDWQAGYDEGRRMGVKHMFSEVDRLKKENLALSEAVATDDKLLAERDRLVAAIPQCPVHGPCIPYAIEWVEKSILMMKELKAENEALRLALRTIRDESSDLGACECAADALTDSRKEAGHEPV